MTRHATIPQELAGAPFTLREARAAGLTLSALKSSVWTRLGSELYCRSGAPVDPWLVLRAWQRLSPELVFCGRTAAWMHGLDYVPLNPVEAIAAPAATSRTRFGIVVRRSEPPPEDVVVVRGLRLTSLNRTLLDFAAGSTPVDALIAIDMATRLRKINALDLVAFANDRSPLAGCARLRELAVLAEPAESPMETRLRWLFKESGLPRPLVQVDLHDRTGSFIGRADLYYPDARLVIEFDGVNHKNRLVADNRRQNELMSSEFTILRFTTADLMDRPQHIVALVRGMLAGRTHSASPPSGVPFGSRIGPA
jgi:Protein of unknown function (DUF559)